MNYLFFGSTRNKVLSMYKTNDAAHQIDHADEVVTLMLQMDKKFNLHLDKNMIIVIGYYHDIFSKEDKLARKNHNNLAADYILNNNKEFSIFNDKELTLISKAIREHRGSYKGEFSSIYSELVSAADRGEPDLNDMIKRSFKYHFDGLNSQKAAEEVLEHMIEKFGKNGYAKYPKLYLKFFGKKLDNLKKDIMKLTTHYILNIVRN